MSLVGPELAVPRRGDQPTRAVRTRRKRSRRWLSVLAAAAVLMAVAVSVVLAKAARYQPLTYGSVFSTTMDYPGLASAMGARTVNTFGFIRQDVYIPPQREGYTFYLFADVANDGSRAVTIESVGLPPNSALTPAGPTRYAAPGGGDGAPAIPPARKVLHGVRLGPGDALMVAIPVRSWPCWVSYAGFETVPSFNVTYRFLFFTRTVAMPWNQDNGELILHGPFGRPGQPNVVCISNP